MCSARTRAASSTLCQSQREEGRGDAEGYRRDENPGSLIEPTGAFQNLKFAIPTMKHVLKELFLTKFILPEAHLECVNPCKAFGSFLLESSWLISPNNACVVGFLLVR